MTEKVDKQLNDLKDQKFKYNDKIYVFRDYCEEDHLVIIKTNGSPIEIRDTEIEEFLKEIQIKNPEDQFNWVNYKPKLNGNDKLALRSTNINLTYKKSDTQVKVENALLDMLKKVSDDPKHIPQAKAVVDISNAFVKMEKSQIDLMKIMKRK